MDNNEVMHARSERLHTMLQDLSSRKIDMSEFISLVDKEAKTANIYQPKEFFKGIKGLANKINDYHIFESENG